MAKKKLSISKLIINLMMLIPTIFRLVFKVVGLIGFEAQLAGKSLFRILVLGFINAILLATTWVCLLGLLIVYLLSLHWTLVSALIIVILLNLLFILIVSIIICKQKKNITFPETRHQLQDAWESFED